MPYFTSCNRKKRDINKEDRQWKIFCFGKLTFFQSNYANILITRGRWWLKRLFSEFPPWDQHPGKFNDHKSCKRGDIIISIWHVTNLRSYNFNVWSLSQVTILPSLVAIGLRQMEIWPIYFVTRPHVTMCLKACVILWVEAPQSKLPPCQVWCPLV